MTLKLIALSGLKILALTIVMFLSFTVAAGVVGEMGTAEQPAEPATAALALLAVCFLNSVVLGYLITRSRWAGWRLMATIFIVFYGVMTFMGQIESAVYITRLPVGMLPRLFLMGLLIAAPFAVLAVFILGKHRHTALDQESKQGSMIPFKEWAWKMAVLAIVYVTLYFTFGHFIAWQSPAVREYYGGTGTGSFFAQMRTTLGERFWLLPFQFLRGLMWILLALPVIRMLRGQRWETALAVGFLFSVVMNAQLLLPNPFMPEEVRIMHLVETATSNFIFGGLVGWMLSATGSEAVELATSHA
ncbi:MAG: hypothetical protein ACREOO_25240 [bacterium]